MLTYVEGDLLTSPAQTLVNAVNTVGSMGKGIARRFAELYPEMVPEYRRACHDNVLTIGHPWLFRTPRKLILNFPTKGHWRSRSRLDHIERGLEEFSRRHLDWGIWSVAFPALGCGSGGLPWPTVQAVMERHLRNLPIEVFVYPPRPLPQAATPGSEANLRQWLHSEPHTPSDRQTWNDVVALAQKEFGARVSGDGWDWHGDPEPLLSWGSNSPGAAVAYSEWRTAWELWRQRGVLTPALLRDAVGPVAGALFGLVAQLPYAERVRTASAPDAPFSEALQLRIPSANEPLRASLV